MKLEYGETLSNFAFKFKLRRYTEAAVLEDELAVMKPDMSSIDAFRAKDVEYEERAAELRAVTEERDTTRGQYDDLRKRRLDEFMTGFNIISLRLKVGPAQILPAMS